MTRRTERLNRPGREDSLRAGETVLVFLAPPAGGTAPPGESLYVSVDGSRP